MPSLRSFRYKGFPIKLSLMSPVPALERVDLDVSRREYKVQQYLEPVSRILTSFSCTRALKLRLGCIEDIVAGGAIPPTFPDLELLEVEGHYKFNRLAPMSSAHRDIVQLGGVSELPASLTDNSFSCLQKSLRKVTLKFKAMEVNCFQVQLAKFLVGNAMVLEEMQVDDGDQFS
ncbi:hypothetical protein ZWY2020_009990 [Hordeum vulgare]|nr:hypothetical protein ZWY2020_009990 [Hordeum vulgare]